jgi:hypothetical protein
LTDKTTCNAKSIDKSVRQLTDGTLQLEASSAAKNVVVFQESGVRNEHQAHSLARSLHWCFPLIHMIYS